MLDEAEGLSEDQLPAYNAVLWFWLVCSALSLPAANRPGARRFAIAGLLNFPILLASAQHHFRWAREQAELRPGALEPGAARMSGAPPWPGGARRGAQPHLRQPRRGGGTGDGGAAGGRRRWATTSPRLEVVPRAARPTRRAADSPATFFVEGLNAELYPDLLREIDARGHEVAYHAWRHEQWADLTRGRAGGRTSPAAWPRFERLGLRIAGPAPAGRPARRGRHSASCARRACATAPRPAPGAGVEDGVALLPFQWRHVDASCVLPPLAARARADDRLTPTRSSPATFVASLESGDRPAGARAAATWRSSCTRSCSSWLGDERLAALLDRVAAASAQGEVWVARCAEVAEHVGAPSRALWERRSARFGQLDLVSPAMSALGDVAAAILPPEAGGPEPERVASVARRMVSRMPAASQAGLGAALVGLEAFSLARTGRTTRRRVRRSSAKRCWPRSPGSAAPPRSTRSSRSSCSPTAPMPSPAEIAAVGSRHEPSRPDQPMTVMPASEWPPHRQLRRDRGRLGRRRRLRRAGAGPGRARHRDRRGRASAGPWTASAAPTRSTASPASTATAARRWRWATRRSRCRWGARWAAPP